MNICIGNFIEEIFVSFVCVCVYVGARVRTHTRVHAPVCKHTWRGQRTMSLTCLGFTSYVRLAGQWALGICLPLPSQCWDCMRMSPHLAFYKYYLGTKSRSACLQDDHFTYLAISPSSKILEPFTAPVCSKSLEEDHTAPWPGTGLSDGLLALLKVRLHRLM